MMGRKSKTTPEQDQRLIERHLAGESIRSLAKEAGVSESALRGKISAQAQQIKDVANQIVTTERALQALPFNAQTTARNRAAAMSMIEDNVFAGLVNGSATFHRLTSIANTELQKVNDADMLSEGSMERMKVVAAATKMANDAVAPALAMVNGNKDRIARVIEAGEIIENEPTNIGEMQVLDAAKAYSDFVSG
jgi:pyruvate/2-oxoglutarate dehydrogenase complex dihydrolipoamide acyltransferase (E2) component